jgi:hypothetical protein
VAPTRKVKRDVVYAKLADIVDGLSDEALAEGVCFSQRVDD